MIELVVVLAGLWRYVGVVLRVAGMRFHSHFHYCTVDRCCYCPGGREF